MEMDANTASERSFSNDEGVRAVASVLCENAIKEPCEPSVRIRPSAG